MLLFDHNLSPRLVDRLADLFPCSHVVNVGLTRAADYEIWLYARENGHAIITKDSDFNDLALLGGFPPKVLWLRVGNRTTEQIEQTLRDNHGAIKEWLSGPADGLLVLRA